MMQNNLKFETNATLWVFAAPSGTGKTSLARALIADSNEQIKFSVSHTTRAPRPGEVHGKDYFFVTPDEFAQMVRENTFLEHATVFGRAYGTSRAAISIALSEGKDVILDIDWQGARLMRAAGLPIQTVFILPPDIATLESRLATRGQDSAAVIAARMEAALAECSHADEFDFVLINTDFAVCLAQLKQLFAAQRQRRAAQRAVLQAWAAQSLPRV